LPPVDLVMQVAEVCEAKHGCPPQMMTPSRRRNPSGLASAVNVTRRSGGRPRVRPPSPRRHLRAASAPPVGPLHELHPALATIERVLEAELVPVVAGEAVRVPALGMGAPRPQDEGVAVPGAARRLGRRRAHAVEPVPGDRPGPAVPAEDAVPPEAHLPIL